MEAVDLAAYVAAVVDKLAVVLRFMAEETAIFVDARGPKEEVFVTIVSVFSLIQLACGLY